MRRACVPPPHYDGPQRGHAPSEVTSPVRPRPRLQQENITMVLTGRSIWSFFSPPPAPPLPPPLPGVPPASLSSSSSCSSSCFSCSCSSYTSCTSSLSYCFSASSLLLLFLVLLFLLPLLLLFCLLPLHHLCLHLLLLLRFSPSPSSLHSPFPPPLIHVCSFRRRSRETVNVQMSGAAAMETSHLTPSTNRDSPARVCECVCVGWGRARKIPSEVESDSEKGVERMNE